MALFLFPKVITFTYQRRKVCANRVSHASRTEAAKIDSEVKRLESAFESIMDSRIREIAELRIKECRAKLRPPTLRSSDKPHS
jgi:hypothetical protein